MKTYKDKSGKLVFLIGKVVSDSKEHCVLLYFSLINYQLNS
jgi:hypothetical protein